MAEDTKDLATRSAGVIGIAVLCSRILGLVRELIFAGLFGAGRALDAFLVAFRTPNLLRDLFAEGALSMAFVTTFSKKIATEGDRSAWQLANKIATLTVVFMSVIVVCGIALAPIIVAIIAPGFEPEKAAQTVLLARIMYPFILLVSLAALVMGMLNAKHRFGVPAMASSFFNLGSIVGGVAVGWWLEPQFMGTAVENMVQLRVLEAPVDPTFGQRALVGLAFGTLIGGLLQLAVQLPSLWKVGFRFHFDFAWRDEGVRRVLRLMAPAVIAASAVQVNVLVNTIFASYLQDGAVSWLTIAFRIMQLPLGVFGVAIGTVTLPLVSRSAALGDHEQFRATLARGMRLAFLLTIPSSIGLMILAEPIISVLYERGRFNEFMTVQTADALRFYAIGLIAYSALKVLMPTFYAIDKKKTPMLVGFLAIGTNAILNWILTFRLGLGHRGLALSTGCVAWINFLILYALMRHHARGLETPEMLRTIGKLAAASAVLVGVCLFARGWILTPDLAFLSKLGALALTIAIAAAAFFSVALLLRIDEMSDIARIVARRFRKP